MFPFLFSHNNTMISSSSMPEQDLLFSSPQSLEQLRQELLSLDQQDHHSLQAIQRDISLYLAQFQQISNQETCQPFPNSHLDLLRDAQTHLRQRSNCINTLSQLAVRMIDCIREQQDQHVHVMERYESDIDALRDQNDCLASKNNYIENDVEYFREHLRAAESQLESIAMEEHQEEDKDEMMKDQMIGRLEEELERIRAELEYYRFSSRSKQSRVRLNNAALNANPSTQSLPRSQHSVSSTAFPSAVTPEQDYVAIIERLQAENQGLRREIRMLESRRSRKGSVITREIRQEQVEETERPQIQPLWHQRESFVNDKEAFNKTSSLSIFQKGALHDFRESLDSPRFDEDCFTPAPLEHRIHPLSTEWSTKSFEVNMEVKASRLIYLNQQDEEQLNDRSCKYDRLQPVIQQTKETEGSVREIEIAPIIAKIMSQMGVNTQQPQPPPQAPSYLSKILQSPIPLLIGMSSFLVKKRVRRSVLRANQAMLMI